MTTATTNDHPAIGKFCILRTTNAGVHAGTVTAVTDDHVSLSAARRLWQWRAAASVSLSGVALHGINQKKSRIAPAVQAIHLERRDLCEFIEASAAARASIEGAPDAEQQR